MAMMGKRLCITLAALSMFVLAAANDPASAKTKAGVNHSDEPERAYRANCGRCHKPPDGLPSRVTSTVIRHMRVRAGLTEKDEMLIRKFMNP